MRNTIDCILRAALAFAFLYPPISAWSDPFSWLGYVPAFAYVLWPWSHLVLLHLFGVAEIVLALWVLSGWRIALPSALACFLLLFIVVTNPGQFEILFRDLSIAAIAFVLAVMHWPQKETAA